MYSSVLWMIILSITIFIQVQPDHHQVKLGEAHHLSLSGNVPKRISYKHSRNEN